MEPRTNEWLQQEEWLFRCNRRMNYACVGLFALSVLGLVLLMAFRPSWFAVWIADITLLITSGFGVERTHRCWLHRSRILVLRAKQGNLADIVPLVEAMNMDEYPNHPEWRRGIAWALVLLLSKVSPEDAARITPPTWERLGRFLNRSYTPEIEALQIAILKAAGAAGSGSILPAVKRCVGMRTITPQEQRVFEAAYDCMHRLEERLRQQAHISTLLRPSAPADPALLLRPADSTETAGDRLLRPRDGRA